MSAIRLARGFTGRDVIVKFAGCYHGHVDSLLASAGSGLATFALPGTPGVPASSTELTLVLPYNDRAAVEKVFAEHGDRIACLITEAAPGNMGVVPPEPGFNAFLAETCRTHGALFVSDEVMTGFRVSRLGPVGPGRRRRGLAPRPDDLRQGDGRRLPGRGVRRSRRRHAPPRARGAGLPGRHALGEPDRHHRRPGHAAAGHRRGLRPPRRGRRHHQGRGRRRAAHRRRRAHRPVDGHHVLGLLLRGPGARLRRRLAHRLGWRTPPSSTPCSTAGSTCRRRRTSRGSSRPPTTSAPCRPCSTPCPTPPRAAAAHAQEAADEPDPGHLVHLLRHGEVHNPEGVLYGRRDGYHLSELGHRWPTGSPSPSADRDITHIRSSPLERAQETAAPIAAALGLEIVPDERVIESTNIFEGQRFGHGAASCASRAAGGTCATRSGRPGASPTSRSWPG